MIAFLNALMLVPWILFAVFLVLSIAFAIQAKPKKSQLMEATNIAAKKKSNIFATISVVTLILSIVLSFVLNSYRLDLIAKETIDSHLFGSSNDDSSSIALSEHQQKLEMLKKYREKLNNGEALLANEIDDLDYLVNEVSKQIISEICATIANINNAYTSAAPEVGFDIDSSVIDSLSGLNKIVVESVTESRQNVIAYLTAIRCGESVSSESTAECVKEIDCILAYAETNL